MSAPRLIDLARTRRIDALASVARRRANANLVDLASYRDAKRDRTSSVVFTSRRPIIDAEVSSAQLQAA